MVARFLLGGISYTAKGLKHMKKHKKKMYQLRQAKKEKSPFYGKIKIKEEYPKTGYAGWSEKKKWLI